MDDFGARLRHAREDRGLPLGDIATRTKISVGALEALERNDVTRLPGGIFGRAFVRAYAQEIGLDPAETVVAFQVLLERTEREAAERGAIRVEISSDDRQFLERQRRAVRALRVGVVVFAIAAVLFLLWRLRPFLASGTAASPETPAAQAVVLPGPPPPAEPAAVAPPEEPGASVLTPSDEPLVVEVSVTATCWIFAAADGGRVVSKLFKPGDSERIVAQREVLLDVGNAGAVQWSINGKTAKPLGKAGAHTKVGITLDTVDQFIE